MKYWLIKSEPSTWSWADHVRAGTTEWDGVRNHQAKLNLQAMARGDEALFYHSGKEKRIMGFVNVVRTYYPDPTDPTGRFGMVDFKAAGPMNAPVTLAQIKADNRLANLALVRNTRLSVQPVDAASWKIICSKGNQPCP